MGNESRQPVSLTGSHNRPRRAGPTFPPPVAAAVERLRRRHPALDDLAETFPALLVAIATGYGRPQARLAAVGAVIDGRPLRSVAQTLALPYWLRALPAAAFHGPLPAMEDIPALAQLVSYALPNDPRAMLPWLDTVMLASRVSGPELGVWIGRQAPLIPPVCPRNTTEWIIAWAFYSRRPETLAGRIIRRPWRPNLGARVTIDEIANWRRRVVSVVKLASHHPPWFQRGTALGYEIVPLNAPEDLFAESARMRNCLDIHLAQLSQESARLYAIRRNGRSVASLELALRNDEPGIPMVVQLKGLRNRRAPVEVWQAVHAWMGAQTFDFPVMTGRRPQQMQDERRAWLQLWTPLREHCRAIGIDGFQWTEEDWITSRQGSAFLGRPHLL